MMCGEEAWQRQIFNYANYIKQSLNLRLLWRTTNILLLLWFHDIVTRFHLNFLIHLNFISDTDIDPEALRCEKTYKSPDNGHVHLWHHQLIYISIRDRIIFNSSYFTVCFRSHTHNIFTIAQQTDSLRDRQVSDKSEVFVLIEAVLLLVLLK